MASGCTAAWYPPPPHTHTSARFVSGRSLTDCLRSQLVVAFSLYDNPAGMGFSIVPGSHKALFPTPRSLGDMQAANSYSNAIVVQPELKAGDALMFTEAARHGTTPWYEP